MSHKFSPIKFRMSVFICDKYIAGFYVSNKVDFQNYFANELMKWFVFEAVHKIHSTWFVESKTLCYCLVF